MTYAYVFEYMLTDSFFPSKNPGYFRVAEPGAIFGFGIEGLRDKVQIGQNVVSLYPAIPTNSKSHPDFAETM